jgi:hypothetical protein
MANRPFAKRRLCKQQPFLGNRSVNALDYKSGNGVFLRGPYRDVISKGQGRLLVSSVRETVKRGLEPEADE